MVEVFVIYVESIDSGNSGFLSRKTKKTIDGIHVEYLREIQDENPNANMSAVVAFFTRGSAISTKDMILNEIMHRYPSANVDIEVQSKQITLADSRELNRSPWSYK